jgi:L-rhamnose mutarotase
MNLPTKLGKVILDLFQYSGLFYGPPKIGKSSLFKNMDALYGDLERGLKALAVYKRTCRYWEEYKELVGLLQEGGHKNYRMFVTDTVDRMYNLCFKYCCEKWHMEHPSDEEYGKGWDKIRTEFMSVVSDVCRLPMGVAFISHSQVSTITSIKSSKDRISPRLTGTARSVMTPVTDNLVYIGYDPEDEDERIIQLRGTDLVEAGGRWEEEFKVPRKVRYKRGMNWGSVLKTIEPRRKG